MAKVRQKISGDLRTLTDAEHFHHLRSYLAAASNTASTYSTPSSN